MRNLTSQIALFSLPLALLLALQVPVLADDGAIQITTGPGEKTHPCWSPDGIQTLDQAARREGRQDVS